MGLPSIVVSLADNQFETCEWLASTGLIRYLGFGNHVTAEDLHEALLAAAEDHGWRVKVSALGGSLIPASVVGGWFLSVRSSALKVTTRSGPNTTVIITRILKPSGRNRAKLGKNLPSPAWPKQA
jgi:hypothetical protein